MYIRKSGGIGVFVKQSLQHAFEIVETDCDYIFWLKLSKQYSKLDQDIMFGVESRCGVGRGSFTDMNLSHCCPRSSGRKQI